MFRTKINEKKSSITTQQSCKKLDTRDIPDLENEDSASQRRNQQGKGLNILILNQMLNRLPISLAQLKAGNNSEKLNNEISVNPCIVLSFSPINNNT